MRSLFSRLSLLALSVQLLAPSSQAQSYLQSIPPVGQTTSAASLPVVIANNQSAIAINAAALTDGSQTSRITDGTNTVSVSTTTTDGFSASANRLRVASAGQLFNGTSWDLARGDTTNGAWVQIKAASQLPAALGQTTMAASLPVAIANNQSPLPVQPATSFALTPTQTTSVNGVLNYDILSSSVSGWYDAQAYMGRMVSLTWQSSASAAGGNMAFEQTNDTTLDATGGAWNLQDSTASSQSSGATLTLAASTTYRRMGVITSRYIRIRLTSALTAGTVDMRVFFTSMSYTPMFMNVVNSAGSALNMQALGSAAQGATASGNPVFTGGVAKTAQPSARTDGQIVAPLSDKTGHFIMRQGQIRDLVDLNAQVTIANTTETTVVAAIASTFNDLQTIDIAGTITFSGSPTEAYLVIRDVAAGTVRWSYSIPVTGGTFNYARNWMGSELKQTTVNTAWTAQIVFVGGTSPAVSAGGIRVIVQTVRNI